MTVHVDKVTPFLGEVPKNWLAGEPSSEVRELPERADATAMPFYGHAFRFDRSSFRVQASIDFVLCSSTK